MKVCYIYFDKKFVIICYAIKGQNEVFRKGGGVGGTYRVAESNCVVNKRKRNPVSVLRSKC